MAVRREINALTPILTDPHNADRDPDTIAELVIQALDEVRARTHRLAVVTTYRWMPGEEPLLAVLGPFSTRATSAAKAAGSAMAGTARGGGGKWMLAPAYANARDAWAAISPPPKEEQRAAAFLASIRERTDNPSVWAGLTVPGSAAACLCGVSSGSWCVKHQKRNP